MKKQEVIDFFVSRSKKTLTEEDLNFVGSIGETVEKAFEMESVERNKQLKAIEEKLGIVEGGESVMSVIRALSLKVDEYEAKTKRGLSPDEAFKLKSMLEAKKEDITSAIRASKSKDPSIAKDWAIEFRAKRGASALMTTATVLSGATAINTINVMDDLEILVIQYPKNFIIDTIGGRQVPNVPPTLRWKEQNTESVDAVGLVTQGSTKNLTDKSFVWKSADRAKYAGRIEFTEELAMDFDQLLLQIIDMFENQVLRSYNSAIQVLLLAWCSAYTSTELDGTFVTPGTSQVIQAAKLWIENNLYEPDLVMLRPGDAALAKIAQNSLGDVTYLPDAVAFHGLTPFVSTNIPVGYIAVGTSSTPKEQHSAFILRRGTYGNQFIENEETIVGEIFSLLKLPTISKASWVLVEIAAMKESLTGN